MRTRSAFAATFAADAAASPGTYTSGLTYASANAPKMPTMRYRPPAILARRLGVGVIVPESAERATGAPVTTVSCTTAIGASPVCGRVQLVGAEVGRLRSLATVRPILANGKQPPMG